MAALTAMLLQGEEAGPCPVEQCEAGCRNLDHMVQARLAETNAMLAKTDPLFILLWLKELKIDGGNIVQFTSFGLSGVIITHLLEQVKLDCPVVFIDTLHHFPETLETRNHYVKTFPKRRFYSYHTDTAASREEFERVHGKELWKNDVSYYDALAKIEPTYRALSDLNVKVWITGRRRSQGDQRSTLEVLELQRDGSIKINPLAHWSYDQSWQFARAKGVYYNPLLDRGYKSVGDIMTTAAVDPNAPERSGRWAGQGKSECGMHTNLSASSLRRKATTGAPPLPPCTQPAGENTVTIAASGNRAPLATDLSLQAVLPSDSTS